MTQVQLQSQGKGHAGKMEEARCQIISRVFGKT